MRIDAIDYDAVRMRRFATALRDFFRRWALYLAIALAVFGAGSNAPLTLAAAAASTLLVPLRSAAEAGWAIVPATLAYALVGALPVVCTRQLWWPRHWADAERALPLSSKVLRRSDLRFGVLVMLPWQAMLGLGGIGVLIGGDSRMRHGGLALLAAIVAACASSWLSVLWMRRVRTRARPAMPRAVTADRRMSPTNTVRVIGAARALVLMPLLRGRATRSATALALGSFATSACATGPLWPPVQTGWSLALFALVALVATSLMRACTMRELRPLWQFQAQWPMRRGRCERARILVVLLPVTIGICLCVACATVAPRLIRPGVLMAFVAFLACACAIEAATRATIDPTDHASRWILLLAIAVAFGSEVAPS